MCYYDASMSTLETEGGGRGIEIEQCGEWGCVNKSKRAGEGGFADGAMGGRRKSNRDPGEEGGFFFIDLLIDGQGDKNANTAREVVASR
jgi:hypothetical protein